MKRTPEPELMDSADQALAYARADFAEPHERFVALFKECFPDLRPQGLVLDLGCGPGDISCRFARAYPGCRIEGIDGAAAMLAVGREDIASQGLADRITLHRCYLPHDRLPHGHYDVVICNSLLHHLKDPMVLWSTLRDHAAPGAAIFVMDLLRPSSPVRAAALVDQYAEGEPEILRRDFYQSLLAAYSLTEVQAQLDAALPELEARVVSDRHWIAFGRR